MRGRPPIKPTQGFGRKRDSSDEETDEVAELGAAFVQPRAGRNYAPIALDGYFDRIEFLGPIPVYWAGSSGPIFLTVHGAGLSASSFAPAARLVKALSLQLVAFDFRGHGQNRLSEAEYEMDSETMISEVLQVLGHVRSSQPASPIVVVGHSMGGAIASKACLRDQESGNSVSGLIMLDVVEGSAIDALPHMDAIVSQRPRGFKSVEQAIQWAIQSGTSKNADSARVSVPPQLRQAGNAWVFRTDLQRTKGFWEGWFRGMNNAYLGVHAPKQLIIAGSDRTDRQMMIAQMQGKFKHTVFFDVGHLLHEDNPQRFADEMKAFADTFLRTVH
jgi:protein phosphatase methylesterase 1